jgi:hypothetical protein
VYCLQFVLRIPGSFATWGPLNWLSWSERYRIAGGKLIAVPISNFKGPEKRFDRCTMFKTFSSILADGGAHTGVVGPYGLIDLERCVCTGRVSQAISNKTDKETRSSLKYDLLSCPTLLSFSVVGPARLVWTDHLTKTT